MIETGPAIGPAAPVGNITVEGPGSEAPSGSWQPVADEPVPALIAHVYGEASQPLRLKLLSLLLRPVGPLALVVIASGAFASFLRRSTWGASELSLDDVARITGEQVLELARYVEQASPDLIAQVAPLVASDVASAGALAGVLLLHALRKWRTTGEPPPGG